MHFVSCPKQGLEMEAVVLHRVGFLEYFCPKQGQDLKPSAAPLYPNISPGGAICCYNVSINFHVILLATLRHVV